MSQSRTVTAIVGNEVLDHLPDWELSLRSQNRAPLTIRKYRTDVRLFAEYLAEKGMPRDVTGIAREHVEMYLSELGERAADNTVACRYQTLRLFFAYLVDDDELAVSPMAKVRKPVVPDDPVTPVLTEPQIRRLFDACHGRTFADLRDTAILKIFLGTGIRCGEMAGLVVDDYIRGSDEVRAQLLIRKGKGRKHRVVPVSPEVAKALHKYLRARVHHRDAHRPELWLGTKGVLSTRGLAQMVGRRGVQAAVAGLHPHVFRHTSIQRLRDSGMSEGDMMTISGHRNPTTLRRYGASAAVNSAFEAYARCNPMGDL